jgi:hypothetical protein
MMSKAIHYGRILAAALLALVGFLAMWYAPDISIHLYLLACALFGVAYVVVPKKGGSDE